MLRHLLIIASVLLFFQSVSWGADKPSSFTQKDFSTLILKEFSWDGGLPKEPTDRDYLIIFGGRRTFRYEAENAYNPETDRVTVREFPLFGDFTGKGWILGVSDTTSSTFTIIVPIAGEYDLKAVIKGNGFVWNINGKEYRSDSKSDKFRETDIVRLALKSGANTVVLSIPPEGAIDSFTLTAPDYNPIKPFAGWRFKESLTAVRMAEIGIALANSYARLPDAGPAASPKPLAVADKIALPATAVLTDANYLGPFYSTKWVRADYRGASFQIPLSVAEAGYYTLTANIMGDKISGSINENSFELTGKPFLSKLNLGLYRLEAGDNIFKINLPPTGGIDTIEFNKKKSDPDEFLRLAGVSGPASRLIDEKEAAAFLKSLHGSVTTRK